MTLKESFITKVFRFVASIKSAAFVIGTALIGFAAVRNSLTWHMQHFWGASHDFWQKQWIKVLDLTGGNEYVIYVCGMMTVSLLAFWLANILFVIMELTGKPACLLAFKIQSERKKKVTWSEIKHTIFIDLKNQVLSVPLVILYTYLYKWNGMSCDHELPTFQWVLIELSVWILLEEVQFYYSHRLLHHPAIYKHIHKMHHEWTAPISLTAIYCHPVEYYFSNVIPVFNGPLIFGTHLSTVLLWIAIANINTTNAHSGYHLPSFPSNEAHDYHHLKFNEMFGVLGILDRLHNTDAKFRDSKQYEHHFTFFSLTPIKTLIPDDQPHSKQTTCSSCSKTE